MHTVNYKNRDNEIKWRTSSNLMPAEGFCAMKSHLYQSTCTNVTILVIKDTVMNSVFKLENCLKPKQNNPISHSTLNQQIYVLPAIPAIPEISQNVHGWKYFSVLVSSPSSPSLSHRRQGGKLFSGEWIYLSAPHRGVTGEINRRRLQMERAQRFSPAGGRTCDDGAQH